MFVVRQLKDFPEDAKPFADENEVLEVVGQRGLQIDTTMCASCPPMSPNMQLPHLFAHIYAGIEMLQRGREEWQLCQIMRLFVKENQHELTEDTQAYFRGLGGKQTIARYAWSLSRHFQKPDACQLYLLSQACNAHTRLHFANCVWSTIDAFRHYYVVVDLAVIGKNFVLLHSLDQEKIKCVVGEVKFLVQPDEVAPADVSDSLSDGRDSDVDVAIALEELELARECDTESGWFDPTGDILMPCIVRVERLSHMACKQLMSPTKVLVEHVAKSALWPNTIFKAAEKNRSQMCPGKVFRGCRDWTQCVVPTEKQSVSSKKLGFVFSSHSKPCEKPLWSSTHPGIVFRLDGVLPACLDAQLHVKCLDVQQTCCDTFVKKFNCLVCVTFVADTLALVKRHIENMHSMYTCPNAHCVAGFKTERGRDVHCSVHIKKVRSCTQCHKVFDHRYALKRHMVCHNKVRKHRCLQCGRKYFRPQDLKEHLQTVHNAFTFPCGTCKYVGQSACALKQHELVHEAPKLKCHIPLAFATCGTFMHVD